MLTSLNQIIAIRASTSDSWLDLTSLVEGFSVGDGDLTSEDSGRTLDGTMHNNVVIDKEYYDISFKALTWSEMASIMNVVKNRKKIQFKYPSPMNPGSLSINWFYCQDRTGECKMIHKKTNGNVEIKWSGLAFRLAEI